MRLFPSKMEQEKKFSFFLFQRSEVSFRFFLFPFGKKTFFLSPSPLQMDLFWAIYRDDIQEVTQLIKLGRDLNIVLSKSLGITPEDFVPDLVDYYGFNVLVYALVRRNFEIAKLLKKYGATVDSMLLS